MPKPLGNVFKNNIFYALVSKFPHIREYADLDKVFSGPIEPCYTYLKCLAAVCPLIIAGTALIILYVSALQSAPELALFVCIPAVANTTVASLFVYDFAITKSYEYKIAKILRENTPQEDTNNCLENHFQNDELSLILK